MPQLQSRNHLVQDHNVVSDVDMMMHSWDQIFNPEAAKSMFTKLFHLMDQQNGTIEKLEAKVHRVESYLPTQLEHKDREIQKLTQQLKATQSQLAQVQNQNHQHAQQLRKLEKIGADHDIQLSNCHNQLELVHDQSRSVMKTLHQDTIRMEHYDTLQEGLEQLVQAQEALGKVLECKMNKLEGHQVESMCAKMKNYLQSFDRLTSQLEAAQQDLSQVQSTLTRESSLARDTASKVQTLSGQIHDCVLPELKYIQETALVSIERTCDQHQEQLEVLELCTRDNRRSIDELERHVKHSQVKLTKTFVTLKGKINQALSKKSNLDTMNETIANLQSELACKGWQQDTSDLVAQMKSMTRWSEQIEKQVQIALRFIHWFSSRGEAYDHNFRLVETHLQKLAVLDETTRRRPSGD